MSETNFLLIHPAVLRHLTKYQKGQPHGGPRQNVRVWIHPLWAVTVCTNCCVNPSNSGQDMPLNIQNISFMMALQEKSEFGQMH